MLNNTDVALHTVHGIVAISKNVSYHQMLIASNQCRNFQELKHFKQFLLISDE